MTKLFRNLNHTEKVWYDMDLKVGVFAPNTAKMISKFEVILNILFTYVGSFDNIL